jgi:hypothetical protein
LYLFTGAEYQVAAAFLIGKIADYITKDIKEKETMLLFEMFSFIITSPGSNHIKYNGDTCM